MTEPMRVDPGMLLAAWPDMLDPNFMHSVVLVCQHTSEGAYGLTLNRPAPMPLGELLPDHPLLSTSRFAVYLGGPVDEDVLQFVHAVPDDIPGGIALDDELYLGGDLEALAHFLSAHEGQADLRVKVFLGYAGWGAAQLEAELSGGSWIPAPASSTALFEAHGEQAWRAVVRSSGQAGNLEQDPPDISWN